MLWFKKEVDVDIDEDQTDVEDYPDEEEIDDVNLEDERERHRRMVFKDNDEGVGYKKVLLYSKRWYVCVHER